ncbi:MAG TPA: TonB-dependent receptor [Longimicrobium sp.]|nr:TonB-dependent receptor [Longimicrobium sp.]
MKLARALALALSAAALAARAAGAQTVQGAFVDPASGEPIAGARAVLRDPGGREIAAANTGRDGGFVLRAPAAGSYVLRVERIGYALTESPAFTLAADETVRRRVTANPGRIALQGIVVQARSRCTPRPGSGPQTATVWEEARKALGAARASAESGDYRYAARRYWRRLDAAGQTILSDSGATAELATGTPFMAVPLERLSREGYVETAGADFLFHAPDARVLLSTEFQETHCFAVVEGEDGLIGLSFEPVSTTRPDVRGTLWLDRASAELRRLEYRYTRVPGLRREADAAGGRMEFTHLPDGRWIVGRWSIRMPIVTATRVQGSMTFSDPSLRDQNALHFRLAGIREEGGEVLSAAPANGAAVRMASAAGTLAGTVFDSTTARPLAGARVSAAGHEAVADSIGRYAIEGLPPGDYEVSFTAPALDALRYTPPPVRATVREGAVTERALAVPPLAVVWASRCEASPATGALVGVVRGAAGQPSPGARVTVAWSGARAGSTAAVADSQGVYRVCDAPAGVPLAVRAATPQGEVSVSDVQVAAGRPRREDLALAAPRAAAARGTSAAPTGISGILRDAGGRPLAGATVRMDALPPVQTDAQGRFRFRAAAGEHRVSVTHPAIGSRAVAVRLPADAVELELRAGAGAGTALAASVQRVVQLAGIGARAQARSPGLDARGFYERQRVGVGVFLTDAQIQRSPGAPLSGVLRMVSGVSIIAVATGSGGSSSMRALSPKNMAVGSRGSTGIDRTGPCFMDVYLDGSLVAGPSLGAEQSQGLDDLPTRNVEAVEVYRGGSEIPSTYRNSTSTCGVILIWTRR